MGRSSTGTALGLIHCPGACTDLAGENAGWLGGAGGPEGEDASVPDIVPCGCFLT